MSGFVKSANECRQSIPLPLCDLSQSSEAQRTLYSRTALLQRERSTNTEPSEEAAAESSLFDFVNQGGKLMESKFQPVPQSEGAQRCLQRTRSNRDRTLGRLIVLKRETCRLSVCQLDSTLPQVEELVGTRWAGRACTVPEACQTQTCHIS